MLMLYKHYAAIRQTMSFEKKHRFSFKIWLEYKEKPVLGKGGAQILEQIEKAKSISKAAKNLGMSYRYVWNYLQKIEKLLKEPVIDTFKGGKSGGGGAKLTALGEQLLDEYKRLESYLGEVLADAEYWKAVDLEVSARNRLKGMVKAVEKDDVVAKVKIEIAVPTVVTALISREAVEDLGIKVGDSVEAVIKAADVMIAK
ncbi:molybdenum-dependent transcriptional regulator [Candidatus Bathyarchaeota archaeon]|nr:MAG: molybdenum-dependent transcriptional regulator [Candidatus Bathyarchaeota archaeon]